MTVPLGRVLAQAAAELASIALPPPISAAERMGRLAKSRQLMQRHGIGSVIVESGPSLDYLTGIQWWRSERLTAVVIPARGDPIVVCPFFEQPSIKEMLQIPAEIRTWQEDEEPLRLVADFLKERRVVTQPVAFEETNRIFIEDRLKRQLPSTRIVSANPVIRAQRMIKSPTELALMQTAYTSPQKPHATAMNSGKTFHFYHAPVVRRRNHGQTRRPPCSNRTIQ